MIAGNELCIVVIGMAHWYDDPDARAEAAPRSHAGRQRQRGVDTGDRFSLTGRAYPTTLDGLSQSQDCPEEAVE